MNLEKAIENFREKVELPRGEIDILRVGKELELAEKYSVNPGLVQRKALSLEILPARYLRNFGTVGLDGQKKLLSARVGIAGAGGLGGWLIELLARMGIGELFVVDDDVFEDNNLNRQLFSLERNLGRNKVDAAGERVKAVNSGVAFSGKKERLRENNGVQLFEGCNVVCDGLDNLPTRVLLQETARRLKIPMVHGAIGGYCGQVMTILPGDRGLESFYPLSSQEIPEKLSEEELGNPAATPAMIASWQVQEVVKIILGEGELLRNRMIFFDARLGMVETFQLSS